MKIELSCLNEASEEEFVQWIGSVYEESPWVARRTWRNRPFETREGLWNSLQDTVKEASLEDRLALIRSHPDLVGRAARKGSLTPASNSEQKGAGLNNLCRDEIEKFEKYNREYHARFDFPFVICARENKKESILSAFPLRLRNSREEEVATALVEIGKIARFRLYDIVTKKKGQ